MSLASWWVVSDQLSYQELRRRLHEAIHSYAKYVTLRHFGLEDKCTKDKAGKSTSGLDHPTQVYSLKVDFSDPSWPDHSKVLCDAAIGVKRCHLLK